jgi:hypothetical protein
MVAAIMCVHGLGGHFMGSCLLWRHCHITGRCIHHGPGILHWQNEQAQYEHAVDYHVMGACHVASIEQIFIKSFKLFD